MEVSHFKISIHIFKRYHFWRKCRSVRMKCYSYNFYIIDGHFWSLQCSIVIHPQFVHHIYLLKVDGGLSFKVSTHIFKKYHFWIKCCSVRMKCCSFMFYIIDGHSWSLQCSSKMNAEFLQHIYLLKVDGGLSF